MPKPIEGTFPTYFSNYINKVSEVNLATAFKNQQELVNVFFDSISEEKSNYAYAAGKWTMKEMLQHIIDAERIFAYRALCIARKEKQSMPGFDENEYAANSNANSRSWISLIEELKLVRQTTELLFETFAEDVLNQSGISNNNAVTVNAIGFITVGHLYHHVGVIKEKYL